jgi:FkbM family methyltransferase
MYFDIGANIGDYSISNKDNATKIIAIEASPNTYSILKRNTKDIDNIECLNYAVTNSKNKNINFYDCDVDTISSLNKERLTSNRSKFWQ